MEQDALFLSFHPPAWMLPLRSTHPVAHPPRLSPVVGTKVAAQIALLARLPEVVLQQDGKRTRFRLSYELVDSIAYGRCFTVGFASLSLVVRGAGNYLTF